MVAQSMPIMQQFCTTGAVLADGDIVLYPNLSDALAAHQHATSARAASARGAIPS
jgi:ABC-type polysaccharide/polyol phosphate transport system ATPase subunit